MPLVSQIDTAKKLANDSPPVEDISRKDQVSIALDVVDRIAHPDHRASLARPIEVKRSEVVSIPQVIFY